VKKGETMNISVFRKDRKNVGDWFSLPSRYLPMNAQQTFDLAQPESIPNEPGVVILGGGGLGRPSFQSYLDQLMRPDRKYKVIAWGVGSDTVTTKGRVMSGPEGMSSLLTFFNGMDDIGTRIYPKDGRYQNDRYRWVPCASCLNPLFGELRKTPITHRFGVYEHLRESLLPHISSRGRLWNRFSGRYKFQSNRGIDLRSKLLFMAQSEFVVTNSYHGVYWGTLLGRKVICVPFKNGLFSFRHPPSYLATEGFESALDLAKVYPNALDESREANLNFYSHLLAKYGDL
jgi:hypothetical protein